MARSQYDVFLSYKSEDVHMVRRIAETLIANRYAVWFAEYQVLLQNYNSFQEAINIGIESCRYGLCFTNDRYIESQYCRHEIEQLLDPLACGPDNIIEIMMPYEPRTHELYPDLLHVHSLEHKFIEETLSHIEKKTRLPINYNIRSDTSGKEDRRHFDNGRERYSLDIQGWDVSEHKYLPSTGGDIEGPKLSRQCKDFRMWGNLIIGNQVDNPRAWGKNLDDRECYKYAMDFAKHYFYKRWWWRLIERPVGLHIFFSHGFSHIGFTAKNCFSVWTRRYSVIVHHPKTDNTLEFAFIFFFQGPFTEFCRYAYLMDDLVESLDF